MSFPENLEKAIQEYVQGCEGWREISIFAGAANMDLHYGDTSSEDYPGFTKACKEVSDWLRDEIGVLYAEEDSGCVSNHEPQGAYLEMVDGAEDTEEWCETGPYYILEPKDIATILFGSELARYL